MQIAQSKLKLMTLDITNIFRLHAQGRIKILQTQAQSMQKVLMTIHNVGAEIKAKLSGGQMFIPADDDYQCLCVDGDQQRIIPNGVSTVPFQTQCTQQDKSSPSSGEIFNLTDQKLKRYYPGMTQQDNWNLQSLNPEDQVQSISGIFLAIIQELEALNLSLSAHQT